MCPLLLAVQCSSSLHPLSYSHNLTDIPLLVDPSCLAHICTIPGAQCAVTIIKKKQKPFYLIIILMPRTLLILIYALGFHWEILALCPQPMQTVHT